MAKPTTVWGIDIGQSALKALKLRETAEGFRVEAFELIEHAKILSQPDADRQQLIRDAMEQFLSRNDLTTSRVVVSVPGQSSFTRFVKLPPVEPKRIPEIVRFEATQQIPFPIDGVIWRWQTFSDPDSPDVEAGIFAIKRQDVQQVLEFFTEVDVNVEMVQMAPLALYNFMTFDNQVADGGATLLADVGTDKTDLVVSDGSKIWTRTIQIGGNNFTDSLVRAFKLSFPKAEKLKRSAATSKYARQIFQAMRPVFSDMVQEIQRSIGYYTSTHRDAKFKRLVGLGNGFRLPGLQKYLEQNLNMEVLRVDNYNRLTLSEAINNAVFTENVPAFAVAYGLAMQGLDQTLVNTNLLPEDIARQRRWSSKKPWFIGAAACLLGGMFMPFWANYRDSSAVGASEFDQSVSSAATMLAALKNRDSQMSSLRGQRTQVEELLGKYQKMLSHREFWPAVQTMISRTFSENALHQSLLNQYALATTTDQRESVIKQLTAIVRNQRQYFVIDEMRVDYCPDLAAVSLEPTAPGTAVSMGVASADPASAKRGFRVEITGRTPMAATLANEKLAKMRWSSEKIAEQVGQGQFKVIESLARYMPKPPSAAGMMAPQMVGGVKVVEDPDPFLPNESAKDDTRFVIGWKIEIVDESPAASNP